MAMGKRWQRLEAAGHLSLPQLSFNAAGETDGGPEQAFNLLRTR